MPDSHPSLTPWDLPCDKPPPKQSLLAPSDLMPSYGGLGFQCPQKGEVNKHDIYDINIIYMNKYMS